jgi:Mrp family chromosome partitioning ATPase
MSNLTIQRALPALDELPVFSPDRATVRRERIVGFETRSIDARPFNLLRTQVTKKCAMNGWSSLGITSPAPGAGKSFVSLNLAAALARVGDQPVYLLDLDLTRASVARYLGISAEFGLSDFLDGSVENISDIGFRVEGTHLAVLPSIQPVSNTAELLSGPRFRMLIEMLRATPQPRMIICDLPPTFANDDAMIALQQLDAYLLVVNGGQTTRRQVIESCAMLDPTPLLGTVLNRYEGGMIDPYGYGSKSSAYSTYY